MKKKKIIIAIVIITLLTIASCAIYLGISYTKLSKPSYIMSASIGKIDDKIDEYTKLDDKYNLGDSFTINAQLDFDLDSEDYLNKSKSDKEYLDKYKTIKNLSNTSNNIIYSQDVKKNKLLLEIHSMLDKEKLLDYKYLIDNSTGYYYVEDILKQYVNEGTNNYFEMLNENSTTLNNREYLHKAFVKAIQSSLKDEYFTTNKVLTNVNGDNVKANQTSIRIDDKMIHKIINDSIDYLKKDKEANRILSSMDENFSKYKLKANKTILKKNENYTINIYTSSYLNNILKYEVIHLDKDEKTTYTYEGDETKGNFYYIEDDTVMYTFTYNEKDRVIECKIKDSSNKDVGIFKVEKNDTSVYYTFNFDNGDKKYDIIYSSKYSNFKKNKSFNNEKKLSFKYLEKKVSVLSGDITLLSKVTNKSSIKEEIGDAVLSSTLTTEQKEKFDNKGERIKERLKK